MLRTLNFKALLIAVAATLLLVAAIVVGSRRLQNFDAALIAYLFGTIFACFGIVYRYVAWLQRPPTRLFWRRGWGLFFSGRMFVLGWALVRHFLNDIVIQRFVMARGKKRWAGHMLMAWGCLAAFAVTLPMTFGWIHFGMKGDAVEPIYVANLFGFPVLDFKLHTAMAFFIFHVLDWCSLAIIIGVTLIMRRRLTDAGLLAIQTFEGDWLPLILLLAISVTGLGLSWDNQFMQGHSYEFMAITHAVTVILFLVWMPFGKFFHIFQRPAQLGIAIYRKQGAMGPQAVCPHTGAPFASRMHVDDLKRLSGELGFDFSRTDGTSHLDLSPQGKRAALAKAHMAARKGEYFG